MRQRRNKIEKGREKKIEKERTKKKRDIALGGYCTSKKS